MPLQKLSAAKKNKEWQHACVDYIIGHRSHGAHSANNITRKEEMKTYYDLYNGKYNEQDLRYVTNPFKQADGFPAKA